MTMFQQKQITTDLLRTVSEYFSEVPLDIKEKTICVCLSGGADSVALLRALLLLRDKFAFQISACHFNHQIRGNEADRDESFCKELCKKLDIKLYCGRDDVPAYSRQNKLSLEEAARECRYAFFSRILSKDSVDFCATAHNMNDDAETLLLNLVRGSGSNGASSIAPYYQSIFRPFLKVKRDIIESFLSEIGQEYVTDSTNASLEYTRNFVRNVILPELQKINPSVVESLSRFSDSCREDRLYFENIIEDNLDSDLRLLPKSVRDRVLLRKYKDFSGTILNSAMVSAIEKSLFTDKRCLIPLHGETEAVVEKGKVCFLNRTEDIPKCFQEQFVVKGFNSIFGNRVEVFAADTPFNDKKVGNNVFVSAFLASENIKGELRVRNRSVGDKIFIHGVNKSLKKLFIDNKIPKEYRDIIPIFFDDMGIIYVPFIGVADRVYKNDVSNGLYLKTVFNTIDNERWSSAYEK